MRPTSAHLSPDDFDAWLAGALAPVHAEHLAACSQCQERARLESELDALLRGLPQYAPAAGFEQRVMASVRVRRPFRVRSLAYVRGLAARPRALAFAAGLALIIVASMATSVVWTLGNRETLSALGAWAGSEAAQLLWVATRAVYSSLVEQPWYAAARRFLEDPARLLAVSAAASLVYLSGLLALRRLLALPTVRVADAAW
jgi:anti-sigma factor RsiW